MSKFYEVFMELCREKDVPPTVVANDIGLSGTSATYWKRGAVPRRKTLQKLADYFNVPLDVFLVGEDDLSSFPWLLDEPFTIPEQFRNDSDTLRRALDRAEHQLNKMREKDMLEEEGRWKAVCAALRKAINGERSTAQNGSTPDNMSDRTIELLSIFSQLNDEGQRRAVEWMAEIKKIPEYRRYK